ncbi:DUF3140 domain-containing protein [Streptomyces pratensis]|uniref:DUF3140 domain-containing protein n=1 Tax=Streptomyces pratensis TaxID=1169025 RepID=UPI003015F62D
MSRTEDGGRKETIEEFGSAVNMTSRDLKDWLATDASQSAGQPGGDGESVGHASGRRIVSLLEKKESALTDDDVAHMRKVVGYVHRHLAQRPDGDVTESRWRHSLMNWGHDPLK